MTIEEMKKRKKELGYSYTQISELSGVPLGTVQKIFGGITKAPRHDTLRALEQLLAETPSPYPHGNTGVILAGTVKESLSYAQKGNPSENSSKKSSEHNGFLKKKQGEYTLEDYYALPEERRVELINGVFYDMASPSPVHQAISMFISNILFNFVKENKGGCRVYTAPLDVQLNRDNKTMVQPDILVVCGKETYQDGRICGAPDLVVEILSESTRSRDLVLKLNKYCEAGVREYWTVDPKQKEITVFTFAEEIESNVYAGTAVVPVGIYEGNCKVDLAELFEYISGME